MSKPAIQDRSVADAFVDQLVAWGVRFVYGIPGGSILGFAEAVERSDKLQHILVQQESTAAFMVSAYGRLTLARRRPHRPGGPSGPHSGGVG